MVDEIQMMTMVAKMTSKEYAPIALRRHRAVGSVVPLFKGPTATGGGVRQKKGR